MTDESLEVRGEVRHNQHVVLGGSGAGAHVDIMCHANYPTVVLGQLAEHHRRVVGVTHDVDVGSGIGAAQHDALRSRHTSPRTSQLSIGVRPSAVQRGERWWSAERLGNDDVEEDVDRVGPTLRGHGRHAAPVGQLDQIPLHHPRHAAFASGVEPVAQALAHRGIGDGGAPFVVGSRPRRPSPASR